MNLMPNVEIKKNELLQVLRDNLVNHKEEIAELKAERQKDMIAFFADELAKVGEDGTYQPKENINFPMPQDNSDSYEKAIRMVEMSVSNTIELSESQFDQLVMDNWLWKQALAMTSALYKKF